MRLIDADKLLEETRRDRDYAAKNGFMDMYNERQVLIERIEVQPTAYDPDRPYDPDKVVEQLEAEFKKYYGENWNKAPYLVKAIEIVKAGGTDDTH